MKILTSVVILFLISLSTSAQVSNKIFTKKPNQQKGKASNNLRTTSNNKQQLDSIISPSTRYIYTYDASGNPILEIEYGRSNVTDPWTLYLRDEYGYDAAGNTILHIQYRWDDLRGIFVQREKYEYGYDANKNEISKISYTWDVENVIWVRTGKSENSVGTNGKISKTLTYYWDGSAWADYDYTEFTYNSKALLLEENKYRNKITYTYDAYDNVTSLIRTGYNIDGGLSYGDKNEYTYDAANNRTSLLHLEWSIGIEDWVTVNKVEYEFDLQNNNTTTIDYNWHNKTNTWVQSYENMYTYDNAYTTTDLTIPTMLNGFLKHKLISRVEHRFANNISPDWQEKYAYYYNGETTTTGVTHANSIALTVYPNPAKDKVVFTNQTSDAATLELFNLQGDLVYTNTIIMNQPVSVQGMTAGIYFYRISNTNTGSYNGTLIID